MKFKIKKGDKVRVLAGKDKRREGVVEKVFYKEGKLLIPGINLYKKHVRSQGKGKKGGIIDGVRPLPIASVALVCPKCSKPTRVGFRQDGEKRRICKKCQEVF